MISTRTRRGLRLSWPARPNRSRHKILGNRNTWKSACGGFRIVQFPGVTARFQAIAGEHELLGAFGSLARAKFACQRAVQEREGA